MINARETCRRLARLVGMMSKSRLAALAASAALLSGCTTVPAPVSPVLPSCTAVDPVGFTPLPALHDKFLGRYLSDGAMLDVSRQDGRMLIGHPGQPARSIRPEGGRESWTFVDACGARYDFVLPPDGPGAWLTVRLADGTESFWQRTR